MPPTAIVCPFAEIWTRQLPFPSCATWEDLSFLLSVMHIAAGRWTFCLHFTLVLILFFWRTYSLYLSFTNFHLPPWFPQINIRLENRAIKKKNNNNKLQDHRQPHPSNLGLGARQRSSLNVQLPPACLVAIMSGYQEPIRCSLFSCVCFHAFLWALWIKKASQYSLLLH